MIANKKDKKRNRINKATDQQYTELTKLDVCKIER